jgi:hypothetical protein
MHSKNGYTLIVLSIFIFVFITGVVTITTFATSNIRAVKRLNGIRVAGFLADAGIQKTVWCLNHDIDADCNGTAGENYSGETATAINTGTFTTSVINDGDEKIVHATGTSALGIERALQIRIHQVTESTDFSFNFGAQVGEGGITMGNNSVIVGVGGTFGNVHANGTIVCGSNSAISGTAIVSSAGNQIDGCDIGYDGSGTLVNDDADAWAHTLKNCRVAHDGNIPTGGSSQSCTYGNGASGGQLNNNITLPPPPTSPITDQHIIDFQNEALIGGIISGDYTSGNESMGPKKIAGDLTVSGNTTLTLTGTLWVEGNVLFENNSDLALDTGFGPNSGLLFADNPANQSGSGIITIQNSVGINGSGDPDSYTMLLSTNSSGNAIDVGNSATNAIYATNQGTIKLGNNAEVKAVLAYGLDVGNNMTLTYESGLANSSFTNGPGGVWALKRETWQITK